jgi:hypothetical protein
MILNNHALMLHHHYSWTELEDMTPMERQLYIDLLQKWVAEENERISKKK